MAFNLRIVDAFTENDQPFTGNPAAICFLDFDDQISDEIKQKIATELNLSETAFVSKAWNKDQEQEKNTFTLRWFTPNTEIALCGHATLASSRAVFDTQKSSGNLIKFQTKFYGILEAVTDSSRQTIRIDLPLNDCIPVDTKANPWVEDIVQNVLGNQLSNSIVQDIQISAELKYLVICLKDDENYISKISPNYEQLLQIDIKDSLMIVIVTQKGKKEFHFCTRTIAPWFGVTEDPVCGSAHTVLAPYWRRQYAEIGVQIDEFVAKQCSPRGGVVRCKIVGDRVQLSGTARTIVKGSINV